MRLGDCVAMSGTGTRQTSEELALYVTRLERGHEG